MRGRTPAMVALAALVAGLGVARAPAERTGGGPRFEVLAHVNPGEAYAGDVWGHGSYAYLSSYRGERACGSHGVRVYDLREPRRPRLVSRFGDARSNPDLADTWTEKTIVKHVVTPAFTGDLAVTSFQSCRRDQQTFKGFGLYDVTRPARPQEIALVATEPRGSHEIWLAARGRRAYVYTAIILSELRSSPDGQRPGRPDFRIFDVTNPAAPRQVGEWGAWAKLGVRPALSQRQLSNANLVHSVITNRAATRAFVSYWDLGTVILDITRPDRPRFRGRTRFRSGEPGNAHSAALARNETVLLESHEVDAGAVTIFDVSKPARPVRLAEFSLPDRVLDQGRRGQSLERVSGLDLGDSVHDPKVLGRTAFFSWYRQGVVAADISNPRRPRFLARFLARPEKDPERLLCPGHECRAVWGVFPTSRYVLASDMVSGLWVLRLVR